MSISAPNFVVQTYPQAVSNIPWTSNRMIVGDHSYRQDNFKRTIPKHTNSLPNSFTPVKRIQPPPAFENAPHLTYADKFAQRFLAQQELRKKIDTYAENLSVMQPGTQPWKLPQYPIQIGEVPKSKKPDSAPNFPRSNPGPPGPPGGGSGPPGPSVYGTKVITHGRVSMPQEFILTRPVEPVSFKGKIIVPGEQGKMSRSHHRTGMAGDDSLLMSERAETFAPFQQGKKTIQQIGPGGGIFRQTISPLAASLMVRPDERDVDGDTLMGASSNPTETHLFNPHLGGRVIVSSAGPPQYEAPPPAYIFSAGTGARRPPPGPLRARAPPPRYTGPRIQQVGLPYDSHTGRLPGGALMSAPPDSVRIRGPQEDYIPPRGFTRTRDAGWFAQGIDDGPGLPTKRKGRFSGKADERNVKLQFRR